VENSLQQEQALATGGVRLSPTVQVWAHSPALVLFSFNIDIIPG
jgi:hypothetical protein